MKKENIYKSFVKNKTELKGALSGTHVQNNSHENVNKRTKNSF